MSSIKETIQAGKFLELSEPGDFFRLLSTVGPVDVEFYYRGRETADVVGVEAGYAEYFRGGAVGEFDRVRVYSATTQQVQFVTRYGSDVRYDRGASSVSGAVDLNPATLAALETIKVDPIDANLRPSSVGALGAGGVSTLMTPAQNLNGAIVLSASILEVNAASANGVSLIAKAGAAPTNLADGEVLMVMGSTWNSGANTGGFVNLPGPRSIPAGYGLYVITNAAMSAVSVRSAVIFTK